MSENPFTDGQQFSAARLNSMYNAHQNEGVLNGLDASTSVNAFDVDVASGELFLNDTVVSVAGATLSLSTSDPEDRIDLISADSTGLTVTQGNPAATSGQPIAPDIPSGDVLVSLIYVRGGSSEILTGDIFNDYRVELQSISPALIDQSLPGDLDESFFDHSGLSNIQRSDHHTPVVFDFKRHPDFFGGSGISAGIGEGNESVATSNGNAAEVNKISVSVKFSAGTASTTTSPRLAGTLDSIEVFNPETSSYITVATPNFAFDVEDGQSTTFSDNYGVSAFVSEIRANMTINDEQNDTSISISGSADIKVPVFE
jgi:hypothetical protein